MKNIRKMISLIMAIIIALSLIVFVPMNTSAEEVSLKDYLDGIDYTRLTQRALRMVTTYKALITMDKMEFEGKFLAAESLTIEEINEIVFSVLNDMHLSLPEVKVLSSLGENLTREQKRQIGNKLIVAISEYTQVAGLPGGGTLAKQLLYENTNDGAELRILNVAEDMISGGIKSKVQERVQNVVNYTVQRAGKAVPPSGAKAGMVGFVFASIDAGQDLLDDGEFDRFCQKLDREFAKVAEFYSRCSQKLNTAVSEKNRGRSQIKFDPSVAYDFDTCKMLGVDNVKMKYTLEGSLVRQTDPDELIDPMDNSGTYEGQLKLVIEGYELDKCFDSVFAEECDLWNTNYHVNDWCQILYRFPGMKNMREEFLSMFIPKVNKPTLLKRTLIGDFSVTLSSGAIVDLHPVLKGVFNSVSDSIDFLFEMNFGQEYKIPQAKIQNGRRIELGKPVCQWHLYAYVHEGKSIDSIHVTFVGNEAWSVMLQGQGVGDVMYSGKGADMVVPPSDFGTVWKPIEKAPNIRFENPY